MATVRRWEIGGDEEVEEELEKKNERVAGFEPGVWSMNEDDATAVANAHAPSAER